MAHNVVPQVSAVQTITEFESIDSPRDKLRKMAELQRQMELRIAQRPDDYPIIYEAREGLPDGFKGVIHLASKQDSIPRDIVTLPTRASKEDVEAIAARIKPYIETSKNMQALAEAYLNRQMIILEGGTSIGKTFAVNRLVELLYGKGVKPIDFYCSGQTDTSQLNGKYVPSTTDPVIAGKIDAFLDSKEGREYIRGLKAEGLISDSAQRPDLQQWAARKLGLTLPEGSFQFTYGAVPRAAQGRIDDLGNVQILEKDGRGLVLHIQEIGLAKPEIINTLLQLRGDNGRLTESFQLWDDSGRTITLGPETFVVFSTNPVGGSYLERKEIDPALARNLIWVRQGELSPDTIRAATKDFLTYDVNNASKFDRNRAVIDLSARPEIGRVIAPIVASFHSQLAPDLERGGVGGDRQKIPLSLDTIAQLSTYLLTSQVGRDGTVDLSETLRRGVKKIYLGRIRDEVRRTTELGNLENLLSGSLSEIDFEGGKKRRSEVLAILVKQALGTERPEESESRKIASLDLEKDGRLNKLVDTVKAALKNPDNSAERRKELLTKLDSLSLEVRQEIEAAIKDLPPPSGVTASDWKKEKGTWKRTLGL